MGTWWAVELVALTVWGWSRIQSLSATRIQLSNSDGWKYTRSWIILQWSILIWWALLLAVSLVNTSFKIHWIVQASSVGRRLIRGGLQAGSPTSIGFQRVLCSPVFRALLPCYIPPSRNQPRRAWDWASWCCRTCCRQTCVTPLPPLYCCWWCSIHLLVDHFAAQSTDPFPADRCFDAAEMYVGVQSSWTPQQSHSILIATSLVSMWIYI